MRKKYQIFISSTYIDLIKERQAAVEAILSARHIPAGMELFNAGNEAQLDVIRRWIDESDIYLLILGGRYGSVDSKSGKSFTELEYEYALETNKPVFAVVANEFALHNHAIANERIEVFEKENIDKYNEFKKLVMSKVCKFYDDTKDIKLAIHETLSDFTDRYKLNGWVASRDIPDIKDLIEENERYKLQIKQLKIEKSDSSHEHSYIPNNTNCVSDNEVVKEIQLSASELVDRLEMIFKLEYMEKANSIPLEWIDDINLPDDSEKSFDPPSDVFDPYFMYNCNDKREFDVIRFVGQNIYNTTSELLNSLRLYTEVLPVSDLIYEFLLIYNRIDIAEKAKIEEYFEKLKDKNKNIKIQLKIWDVEEINRLESIHDVFIA